MGMSRRSYKLLAGMSTVLNFTGEKVQAAGWFGHTKGLHTISICVHNFQGRVSIQGSQMLHPSEEDWFPIQYPQPYTGLPYIQYPRPVPQPMNPNLRTGGESSTFGFSFIINCLWLRATVSRDYLLPVAAPLFASATLYQGDGLSWLGAVDSILLNF